ncbi:MAG: hypothetical protein Kow0063_25550 [Anaerolineae bacterium]
MDQPVGRITCFRLYPVRPLWSLGSGWAALSGGLAAAGYPLSLKTFLYLLLAWFLVDPLLGAVWDLGGGGHAQARGIWQRLTRPRLPSTAPLLRLLPYTQTGSPGYWLARRLGQLRLWWHATFWPEAAREFASLLAGLGMAILLGVILGRGVLSLVLISVLLSWLAALSGPGDAVPDSSPAGNRPDDIGRLWHTLGEFGVPWLIGAVVVGELSWLVILSGMCYSVVYFGLTRRDLFHLALAGQAAAALLLAGLRHPMAAGATAILVLLQWGLYAETIRLPRDRPAATDRSRRYAQPFVVLGMLIAALALAS